MYYDTHTAQHAVHCGPRVWQAVAVEETQTETLDTCDRGGHAPRAFFGPDPHRSRRSHGLSPIQPLFDRHKLGEQKSQSSQFYINLCHGQTPNKRAKQSVLRAPAAAMLLLRKKKTPRAWRGHDGAAPASAGAH
eukprot:scaffold4755_cov123-Isochrysis_galbana.AAC.1